MDSNKINIRDILLDEARRVEGSVGVMLSSGLDSFALLLSLIEVGKNVHVYSFTLDDRESTDFKRAREIAHDYKIGFTPIYLPTDLKKVGQDVYELARLGCRKKTDFECVFPFLYAYKTVKEDVVATGIPADGHFCLSKKGMIHYKNDVDKFRELYFSNVVCGQRALREKLACEFGKKNFDPYYSEKIAKRLQGLTWEELNTPRQKMPIYNSYKEEFDKYKIDKHTNLQKGDSGISELFQKLVDSDLNRRGHKSQVGVFNDVVKELNQLRLF